jgi:hypothetical protein
MDQGDLKAHVALDRRRNPLRGSLEGKISHSWALKRR